MNVHKQLGCGFLEAVYQEALELGFIKQNIVFQREKQLPVYYNEVELKASYKADFMK